MIDLWYLLTHLIIHIQPGNLPYCGVTHGAVVLVHIIIAQPCYVIFFYVGCSGWLPVTWHYYN